jgi:membrane-bound lytic murein transglycosylase D
VRVDRPPTTILGVALFCAACASAPPRQAAAPAPPPASESAPATPESMPGEEEARKLAMLYADLQSQIDAFETGVRLLQEGREELGMAQLAAAGSRIRQGTTSCAEMAGCDLDLFISAYDYLLEEQSEAIRSQGFRLAEAEATLAEESPAEEGTVPFRGEMSEIQRSVNLFKGTDLSQLIELNGPVRAALNDWLTWMRPNFKTAWRNYQFLRPRMAPIYEQAGLPEALLFGILAAESGGKVHAHSRAGAAGPLQFMSATGRRYGLVVKDGFDLRYDPEAATRANVAYLSQYLGAFNDSLEKVLAAYNGGEARMRRIQRSYGETGFWDRRVYYQFPRETREYVPRVLAAAWLFLHPEGYGLELAAIDPATATLEPRSPIALDELAICLGEVGEAPDGWFRTLRNLNPQLSPGDRIEPGDELIVPAALVRAYEELCLDDELLAEIRLMHEANYPERPEMIPYTVRSGDTLGRIAGRFPCVNVRELAAVNNIRPPRYLIRAGQRLRIPACG